MTDSQTTKALLICNYYDSKAQMLKCCEELGELSIAILQHINKGNNEQAILEEMADVYIMLKQMEYMMPFDGGCLEGEIDFKLNRQLERIKEGV